MALRDWGRREGGRVMQGMIAAVGIRRTISIITVIFVVLLAIGIILKTVIQIQRQKYLKKKVDDSNYNYNNSNGNDSNDSDN